MQNIQRMQKVQNNKIDTKCTEKLKIYKPWKAYAFIKQKYM